VAADVNTIKEMAKRIASIRREAEELKAMSGGIQAVDRNIDRILSSVKMLEINISDIADIL
jgi:aspartate oxidase